VAARQSIPLYKYTPDGHLIFTNVTKIECNGPQHAVRRTAAATQHRALAQCTNGKSKDARPPIPWRATSLRDRTGLRTKPIGPNKQIEFHYTKYNLYPAVVLLLMT